MFTKDQIDFDKLHAEIRQTLARQKELKAKGFKKLWPIPTAGHKEWFELYMETAKKSGRDEKALANIELDYLSRRITVLCSILAHAKGKVRNPKFNKRWPGYALDYHNVVPGPMTMDVQAKLIGDEWKQFLKQEPVESMQEVYESKPRKVVELSPAPETKPQSGSIISRIAKRLGF